MNKQGLINYLVKYNGVIFVAIASFCLFTGNIVTTYIFSIIYSALVIISIPGSFAMILMPSRVGIRMAIRFDEEGHKDIDISVWDTYMKNCENRFGELHIWLDLVTYLALLTMFIAAGVYFAFYISISCTIMLEAGRWKLYKVIKDKKTTWGAAAYLHEIQEFLKQ